MTGVMQPFVRDHRDLECVKKTLQEAGAEDIRLFAKIENMDGVRKLEELFPAADEIVIARGDLGNAVHLVNDIFHAVLDGASSIMVTGETAVGDYPVEVIRYMANTVKSAENWMQKQC